MATIRKRTDKDGNTAYHVQIRLKGYPSQTESFTRLTDAKIWAASTESAIRENRHFKTAEAKKHTFNDFVERYCKEVLPNYNEKEQGERRSKLNWWAKSLGVLVLSDVTTAAIIERRNELNLSPSTIDKYLKNLSHAFNIAVNEWQWIEENPVKKIKSPKLPRGRVRYLDEFERARLLESCKESSNEWLYICVVLALATGMRQAELMWLKWPDANLKNSYLILNKTKNGERRRVPLSGKALELLKQHSKIRRLDTQLLFPSKDLTKPIDLRRPFNNALKAAGIEDFRWHDLRHCTASYLAMNGASPAEIAEVLGHKNLSMVKRYAHLSDGHVSSVVESMNAKIFGG